jgi:hypothetical protein
MSDKHGECNVNSGGQLVGHRVQNSVSTASTDPVSIPFPDLLGIETVPPDIRQLSPVSCARDGGSIADVPDVAADNGQIDSLAMQE